jgi:hypothetical protein
VFGKTVTSTATPATVTCLLGTDTTIVDDGDSLKASLAVESTVYLNSAGFIAMSCNALWGPGSKLAVGSDRG